MQDAFELLFPEKDGEAFVEQVYKPMLADDNTDGDAFAQQLEAGEVGQSETEVLCCALLISCAYCVQSFRAEREGARDRAWAFLCDAAYYSGLVDTGMWGLLHGAERVGDRGRPGGIKKNVENNEIRDEIAAWYATNGFRYPTIEAAARAAAAAKLAPVLPSTMRDHINWYRRLAHDSHVQLYRARNHNKSR